MSAILGAGQYLGPASVALTEADYEAIRDIDPGLYRVGLDRKLRNAFFFIQPLDRNAATSDGVEAFSPQFIARFPFRVVGISVAVEASAGSAAVVDLDKALAADPTMVKVACGRLSTRCASTPEDSTAASASASAIYRMGNRPIIR
jgi:hypothetical protein